MKFFCYKVCFFCTLLFSQACNKTDVYKQQTKTLDSLSGAINSMVSELEKVDTIVLQKSIARFTYYKQFINQNINDTIEKAEADNLQHFYASGKTLENFNKNRTVILKRATLINSQLLKLEDDIKNKFLNADQLIKNTLREKAETQKLIETGYQQQNLFHSGLQEFKNSLRGVESLIRTRNNGELPTIIKDTITL